MENLTQYLRIVGAEQAGIHPQVGCYLVLLKQVAEGRIFHSVLEPGKRPPEPNVVRRFFSQGSDLVSIPVTANTSLRHRFTSPLEHVTPGHSFEADYILGFAVRSPEKIAVRWTEDPVRKLEDEVRRVVDPLLRITDWEILRANILADGATHFFESTVKKASIEIKPFAEEYGIDLHFIRVTLHLSRTDAQPDADAAEIERQETIVQLKARRRQAEMKADHQLKILEAEQQAELNSLRRPEEVRDAAVAGMKVALGNVAQVTHRAEDLVHATREIASMMNGSGSNRMVLQGSPGVLGLNAASAGPEQKVVAEITTIAQIIENLAGDARRRRELFSALMHLIAEAYRDESSVPDHAQRYQEYQKEAATLLASDWGGSLSASQYKILNRFKDFRTLQEQFK